MYIHVCIHTHIHTYIQTQTVSRRAVRQTDKHIFIDSYIHIRKYIRMFAYFESAEVRGIVCGINSFSMIYYEKQFCNS